MNWKASWIWLREALKDNHSTLLARRTFECKVLPRRAMLAVSANHIYRLYLNGEEIGRGPDRADPRFIYFDSYELAARLREGRNVLLCLLHHTRPRPGPTERSWCLYDGEPGFLLQLDMDSKTLATDADWKVTRAPGWLPHSEAITRFTAYRHIVDLGAAREITAAMGAGYDDASWSPPQCFPFAPRGPLPAPIPKEIPFLVPTPHGPRSVASTHPEYVTVDNPRALIGHRPDRPTTVKPSPEGAWLTLDFGRPMGGFPEFVFDAQGTGQVDVYYAEGDYWTMADRLLLPSSGEAHYKPLDWRGGRRVAMHFRNLAAPVVVRSVRFIESVYPFQARGEFRCSDETLNGVWRVCRETAWAGMKDHPVDCLTREQALWLGDMRTQNRAVLACFGDPTPVTKGLRQVFRVMHDDGVVPVPGPVGLGYKRTAESLPWGGSSLSLALTLREIFWFTGDSDLVREHMARLKKLYGHFARYEDERGLLDSQRRGLPRLSISGGYTPTLSQGVACWFNFAYATSLRAAAELADAVSETETAAAWRTKADAVRATLRRLFWDETRCVYFDGERDGARLEQLSSTANATAALGGGIAKSEAGTWAETIRTDPAMMPPLSPADATKWLDAFVLMDLELHVRDLLVNYWGSIVRNNEPTLPEMWQPGEASGTRYFEDFSRCHPFGTVPAHHLLQYVLGARPAVPGWRRAVIRPHALGLTFAAGRVPTPLGDLRIAWDRTDFSWSVEIELPDGMEAEVRLPRVAWSNERMLVDGTETWRIVRDTEHRPQTERRYQAAGPREVACRIAAPGRHSIVLESQ